jgi:hypothetical protein
MSLYEWIRYNNSWNLFDWQIHTHAKYLRRARTFLGAFIFTQQKKRRTHPALIDQYSRGNPA